MNIKFRLTAAALFVVAICSAQPQGHHGGPEHRQPGAKEIAQRRTYMMKERLGLDEKQMKKVYKVNLQQAQKMTPDMASSRPSGDMIPGGGPGGMGGHGGRMRGGMGGHGGRMVGPGGGMPTGGHQTERPQEGHRPAMVPHAYEESDKERQKRDKKMRAILDSGQYAEWKKIEAERIREEFRPKLALPEKDI